MAKEGPKKDVPMARHPNNAPVNSSSPRLLGTSRKQTMSRTGRPLNCLKCSLAVNQNRGPSWRARRGGQGLKKDGAGLAQCAVRRLHGNRSGSGPTTQRGQGI